jgi:hypothetical protein
MKLTDEMLKEWEKEAILHHEKLYIRDDIPDHYSREDQHRILSLIQALREEREKVRVAEEYIRKWRCPACGCEADMLQGSSLAKLKEDEECECQRLKT